MTPLTLVHPAMGKRNRGYNFSVARFLEETKQPTEAGEGGEGNLSATSPDVEPSVKKRKVDILDSRSAIFDATKLVPQYRSITGVPERLQKCESCRIHRPVKRFMTKKIMLRDTDTFHCTTKAVCWTRRAGIASPRRRLRNKLRSVVDAIPF